MADLPTTFLCPKRPGELYLTPATCAVNHKLAQTAVDEAKVRLWDCRDCPVGAKNLAEAKGLTIKEIEWDQERASKRKKESYQRGHAISHRASPHLLAATLEFVRGKGRCTAYEAAAHFGRHRETIAERFIKMERAGMIRRSRGVGVQLYWEAVG